MPRSIERKVKLETPSNTALTLGTTRVASSGSGTKLAILRPAMWRSITDLWSSATVVDANKVTGFLKTNDDLKPFEVKVRNSGE
jgi:hypothetical protein